MGRHSDGCDNVEHPGPIRASPSAPTMWFYLDQAIADIAEDFFATSGQVDMTNQPYSYGFLKTPSERRSCPSTMYT